MRDPISNRLLAAGFAAAVSLAGVGTAHAAGYAVYEHGTTGLGNAFAGAAAVAEDPTTIFWNPAGMTHLEGTQHAGSGFVIVPQGDFTNDGSFIPPFGGFGGAPISGNNGRDGGVAAFVGAFNYSHQVSDDIWLGVSLNAPFGLVTDYDPEWVGRYHGIHSELLTINLNPSIAYRATDWLSVGVGVNIQYAYASLSSAVDTGALINQTGNADSFLLLDGANFGFGANVGVLIEPVEGSRIGIHYRSEIEHSLSGDVDLVVHPNIPVIGGGTFFGSANATTTLPDTVAISLFHQLTDDIALLGDATWTQWSDVPALVINLSDLPAGFNIPLITTLNWEDTWRFSAGVIWQATDDLALRLGYAYDQSPVPSATFRTPRVPDDDRHWATIGGTYAIDDGIDLSLAYAHLFVGDVPINNNDPQSVPHFLVGNFDASVDIFSFQLTVDSEALGELF
jgi:long-chain fatty acid transport protein